MSEFGPPDELRTLRALVEALRARIAAAETRVEKAEREACQAREEILSLRDEIAAAQRDQQDLKTARVRLSRMRVRGFLSRLLARR
jgi:predicted  nucleic acid-binding Zn-ribbon protein